MHARQATEADQRANRLATADFFRDVLCELPDDMAKPVDLQLTGNVVRDPAGVLDVFLPVEDLPDRLGLRPDRIPHVNGKDQGAPAGGVVEDDLGGRVGEDPAVPIELAVDADSREGRRQCAGRYDVLNADLAVTAVEVSHPAGAHMSGTDGKPGPVSVEDGEIDELEKRSFEGSRRVVARALGAQRHVGS
jgi:hypothetical protein